jgi:hypothetical protein
MKKEAIIACGILGCALAAGNGRAQVYQAPNSPAASSQLENAISLGEKYQDYIYGVIKTIKKDELVLDKTRYGDDQVFKLQHNTKFIQNGKRGSLADLKVGEMVWIDAQLKKKKKTEEQIARKVITGLASTGGPG